MDRLLQFVEFVRSVDLVIGRHSRVGMLILGSCLFSVFARAEVREWTAKTGQTMDAEYVKLSGTTVIFQRDKKLERYPLDILSDEDQAYVKHQGPSAARS